MDPCKTKTIKLAIQPKWYSKSLDWYNQKANSREGASEPEIAPKTAQATAILCTRTRSRRSVAPRRIVRGRRVRRRYLAGALEVRGVGLDELVRVDILHRPRRRSRHPAGAGRGLRRAGRAGPDPAGVSRNPRGTRLSSRRGAAGRPARRGRSRGTPGPSGPGTSR